MNEPQLRTIVKCLNSRGEIDAFNLLLDNLTSEDIEPGLKLFNDFFQKNPRVLFVLKSLFVSLQQEGRLAQWNEWAAQLLSDSDSISKISVILKKNEPLVAEFFRQDFGTLDLRAISEITRSPTGQRWLKSVLHPTFLNQIIDSTHRYFRHRESWTLTQIYDLLQRTGTVGHAKYFLREKPEQRLPRIANAVRWLIDQKNLSRFSSELRKLQRQPIQCMGGGIRMDRADLAFANQIRGMTAKDAKRFLVEETRALTLLSHGFCQLPVSLQPLVSFFQDFFSQVGSEDLFDFLRPLIVDPEFLSWLASSPVEDWLEQQGGLTENFLIEDTTWLLELFETYPVIRPSVRPFLLWLDQALRSISADEVMVFTEWMRPLVTSDLLYGHHPLRTFFEATERLPRLDPVIHSVPKESLIHLLTRITRNPNFANSLVNAGKLAKQNRLVPMIDQSIGFFLPFINRGRFSFSWRTTNLIADPIPPPLSVILGRSSGVLASTPLCNFNYDWNFGDFEPTQTYLDTFRQQLSCLKPGQVFPQTQHWIKDSIDRRFFASVLEWKDGLASSILRVDYHSMHEWLQNYFSISPDRIRPLHDAAAASSRLLNSISGNFPAFRKRLGALVASSASSKTIIEALVADPLERIARPSTRIDFDSIQTIDVRVHRYAGGFHPNEPIASGLQLIFDEYCPSLNPFSKDCLIDSDQVRDFQTSSKNLFKKIQKEWLEESAPSLHRDQFRGWTRAPNTGPPTRTDEVEFQLFPLLNQLNSTEPIRNAIRFFLRPEPGRLNRLQEFLSTAATHLTLQPYFYAKNRNPRTADRTFHRKIRIRILSDLDLVELIGFNSDFTVLRDNKDDSSKSMLESFGLPTGNIGMKLIAEFGFAFGDLPEDRWPTNLSNFKPLRRCLNTSIRGEDECIRTLDQAKAMVYHEINRFDRRILRQFPDLGARLFNLGLLLPVLERSDIDLLRDLFYGLHTSSPAAIRGNFAESYDLNYLCRSPSGCNLDLLQASIGAVSRFGVLRQISKEIVLNQDSLVLEALALADQLLRQSPKTWDGLLDTVLRRKPILSAVNAAWWTLDHRDASREPHIKTRLIDLIRSMRLLSKNHGHHDWIRLLTEAIQINPEMISEYWPSLWRAGVRWIPPSDPNRWTSVSLSSYLAKNQRSNLFEASNITFTDLGQAEALDLIHLLEEFKDHESQITDELGVLLDLDFSSALGPLKPPTLDLLEKVSSPSFDRHRDQLNRWIQGPGFERSFAAISNPEWVQNSSRALDELHRNSGTIGFFDQVNQLIRFKPSPLLR